MRHRAYKSVRDSHARQGGEPQILRQLGVEVVELVQHASYDHLPAIRNGEWP